MENEEPEESPAPDADAASEQDRAPDAAAGDMTRTELRLRMLSGRKGVYDGPIVAIARGWVSRDSRYHLLAARFLDFAVLMPDHLALCSTGFFSRRPRRQVFREALGRLEVTPIGPEPVHTVRVVGNFSHPIRLELRPNEAGQTFVQELLACTRRSAPETGPDTGAS